MKNSSEHKLKIIKKTSASNSSPAVLIDRYLSKIETMESIAIKNKQLLDNFLAKFTAEIEPLKNSNNEKSFTLARELDRLSKKFKPNKDDKEIIKNKMQDLYQEIDFDDNSFKKDFEIINKWAEYDVVKEHEEIKKAVIGEFLQLVQDEISISLDEIGIDVDDILKNKQSAIANIRKNTFMKAIEQKGITIDIIINTKPEKIDFKQKNFLSFPFLPQVIFHYFHNLSDFEKLDLEEKKHLESQIKTFKEVNLNQVLINEYNWFKSNTEMILNKDANFIQAYINMLASIADQESSFFFNPVDATTKYKSIIEYFAIEPNELERTFMKERFTNKIKSATLEYLLDDMKFIEDKEDFSEFISSLNSLLMDFGNEFENDDDEDFWDDDAEDWDDDEDEDWDDDEDEDWDDDEDDDDDK